MNFWQAGFWFLLGILVLPTLFGVVIAIGVSIAKKNSSVKQSTRLSPVARLFKVHEETRFRRQEAWGPSTNEAGKPKDIAVLTFPSKEVKDPFSNFGTDVDEVLRNRDQFERVVVRIDSPGGSATAFGLVYAQMERLRAANLEVTAVVEQFAASGGYLMCLPAHKIVAPEWAVIGSIGVYAAVPHAREALDRLGLRMLEYTAGDHKRSITPWAEVTEEKEAEFRQSLESIYRLFKGAVTKHRPQIKEDHLDGRFWPAVEALELGFVDEIGTSNDILLEANKTHALVFVEEKEAALERLISRFGGSIASAATDRLTKLLGPRF